VAVSITGVPSLDAAARDRIRDLATAYEQADGAPPLSDQALSQLAAVDVVHLLATQDAEIVGYAQLDGAVAELLGGPEALAGLLDSLESRSPRLQLWAHGTRSPIRAIADARGYDRIRTLWQLRWPVSAVTPIAPAAGVTLRAFLPGEDEDAWLRVNAAAFAHHPEQGGWTIEDIRERESEAWFDPSGFLLAVQNGQVIGFHWTKVHNPDLGEVYVLGVDPQAQGLHLGSTLLLAGLQYLRDRGVVEVLLYVDDDNTVAMQLYKRYGFATYDSDSQYERPGQGASA
jgi:mycothiol synthase